jgi:hypothetical protein
MTWLAIAYRLRRYDGTLLSQMLGYTRCLNFSIFTNMTTKKQRRNTLCLDDSYECLLSLPMGIAIAKDLMANDQRVRKL